MWPGSQYVETEDQYAETVRQGFAAVDSEISYTTKRGPSRLFCCISEYLTTSPASGVLRRQQTCHSPAKEKVNGVITYSIGELTSSRLAR